LNAFRVVAVAMADARARLRRTRTGLLVLGSAVLAWLAIPDPATGAGLVSIGGARALYSSSTLAFATASLLSFTLSFFGFYLVSNALESDIRARIATVVAASPVRSAEYLLGKLGGNLALLLAVSFGSMAAAMAMQAVRGEGVLEPGTYLANYAVLLVPCIAWVAAMALVFECAPALSGRGGDVLYLFVWMLTLPLGLEPWRKLGAPVSWFGRCFDYTGLGFVMREVQRISGGSDFSIGYAKNALAKPPITFPGFDFTPEALGTRAMGLIVPVLLFPVALALFRRFDPARTPSLRAGGARRASASLAALLRLLGGPLMTLLDRVSPDAALTFRARPPLVLFAAASAILGLTLPVEAVRQALLPAVFAVLSMALADVATRERQAGLAAIVLAAPGRRGGFATWKLATAGLVALLFAGVPTARLLVAEPRAGLSALIGMLFLSAAAVALGIATGTPKAFTGLSLALWYLALNAKGHTPALDYGGWWAMATPRVHAGWTAATLLMAAAALVAHRARLVRDG
jgi:hypothetical protein